MSQDRFLSIVLKLFLASNPSTKKIAVPITATREVDLIAQECGVTVVRTKDNHYSMMDVISDPDITFVGGTKGGFIFPDFLRAADGMFAMAKILELMAISGLRLAELDQTLPRLRFVKKSLSCAWDHKGKVMRHIIKDTEYLRRDLIDGVKIYPDPPESFTSILLLPDRERPLFHINVEARDWTTAKQLSDEYERKFLKWRDA
jgi:mannose-1-phosphate guanylyltransferase/phosphomannomutase